MLWRNCFQYPGAWGDGGDLFNSSINGSLCGGGLPVAKSSRSVSPSFAPARTNRCRRAAEAHQLALDRTRCAGRQRHLAPQSHPVLRFHRRSRAGCAISRVASIAAPRSGLDRHSHSVPVSERWWSVEVGGVGRSGFEQPLGKADMCRSAGLVESGMVALGHPASMSGPSFIAGRAAVFFSLAIHRHRPAIRSGRSAK
jgi:hypothetical protein